MNVTYIPTEIIDDNPFQRRSIYGGIKDLAMDIIRHSDSHESTRGLLQVPVGRRFGDRIQLAYGHRRLRAFRFLSEQGREDYRTLPIVLIDLTDERMLDSVWSENGSREDLCAVDKAELMNLKLMQVGTQAKVGIAWGLSRSTVTGYLRILRLPEVVKDANRSGAVSMRQMQALLEVMESGCLVGNMQPTEYIDTVISEPDRFTSDVIRRDVSKAKRVVRNRLQHSSNGTSDGLTKTSRSPAIYLGMMRGGLLSDDADVSFGAIKEAAVDVCTACQRNSPAVTSSCRLCPVTHLVKGIRKRVK